MSNYLQSFLRSGAAASFAQGTVAFFSESWRPARAASFIGASVAYYRSFELSQQEADRFTSGFMHGVVLLLAGIAVPMANEYLTAVLTEGMHPTMTCYMAGLIYNTLANACRTNQELQNEIPTQQRQHMIVLLFQRRREEPAETTEEESHRLLLQRES